MEIAEISRDDVCVRWERAFDRARFRAIKAPTGWRVISETTDEGKDMPSCDDVVNLLKNGWPDYPFHE